MRKEKWNVGDILANKNWPDVFYKIAVVRKTGYSWYYPQYPFEGKTPSGAENHWWSENSSDPFFEMGWYKVEDYAH